MLSTMLSAAINVQFSASCLPVFNEICGIAMDCIFFVPVTLIKIANTPLDKSAALVLSIINWMYCSYSSKSGKKFDWSWTRPDFRKMAGFRICQSRRQNPVQALFKTLIPQQQIWRWMWPRQAQWHPSSPKQGQLSNSSEHWPIWCKPAKQRHSWFSQRNPAGEFHDF